MSVPNFIAKKFVTELYTIERDYITASNTVTLYSDGSDTPEYHNVKGKTFKDIFDITRHLDNVKKSIIMDYLTTGHPCVYKYSIVDVGNGEHSIVRTLVGQLIEFLPDDVVTNEQN